jgi:hypothetical protein
MKAKKFKRFRDFSAKLIQETGDDYLVVELIDKYISYQLSNGYRGTKGVPNALAAGQVLRWDERFEVLEESWQGHLGKEGMTVASWYLKPQYL